MTLFKGNYKYFIKIFLIPIIVVSLNLVFVNRSGIIDKNNICTSDENKTTDDDCHEHCFIDNDLKIIGVNIYKVTFLNLKKIYASYVIDKTNIIDPKSNSPPEIIFS